MPTEVVVPILTELWWQDPLLLKTTGGIAILALLIFGYFPFRELYQKAWHFLVELVCGVHHFAIFMAMMVTTVAFVLVGYQFYYPEEVQKAFLTFPKLQEFVSMYLQGIQVAIIGFGTVLSYLLGFKHWREGRRDKNKSKNEPHIYTATEILLEQLQFDHEQTKSTIKDMAKIIADNQNVISRLQGDKIGRLEKNPQLSDRKENSEPNTEGKQRAITRENPAILMTPEEVISEVVLPKIEQLEEPDVSTESQEENETKKKHNVYKYNKIDQLFGFGKK